MFCYENHNIQYKTVEYHRLLLELCSLVLIVHMLCRPFWISPRQAVVIPVAPPFNAYAEKVSPSFHTFCTFYSFLFFYTLGNHDPEGGLKIR